MKGYKGMDIDMKCRGMKFEIGKTYHVDGKISVCHNGLHFCKKLTDVFDYYKREGNRFFVVEAHGDIKTEGIKSAASDLTIVRELLDIEINRIVCGDGYGDGYGNSYGYGDGYGNGYGYGYCYGDGNGYSDGDGYGYGFGYCYGYGCCYGYGDGDGYGDGNIGKILLYV